MLAPSRGEPLTRAALAWRVGLGAAATFLVALGGLVLAAGLSGVRAGRGFTAGPALASVFGPQTIADWTTTAGLVVLAVLGGLATAATLVARRGLAPRG